MLAYMMSSFEACKENYTLNYSRRLLMLAYMMSSFQETVYNRRTSSFS
jgi:hypothetical protein